MLVKTTGFSRWMKRANSFKNVFSHITPYAIDYPLRHSFADEAQA